MGFHSVLKMLSKLTSIDYYAYLGEVRAHLSTIFKEYNDKFGAVWLQRSIQPSVLVKNCLG
jgi:hypothetical protein